MGVLWWTPADLEPQGVRFGFRRSTQPDSSRRPDGVAPHPRFGQRPPLCRLPPARRLQLPGAAAAAGHRDNPLLQRPTVTKVPVDGELSAHLDPDLSPSTLPRPAGWRPLFGQVDRAQGHLRNQGVGPGDLFLFFGLFSPTSRLPGGRLRYAGQRDWIHVLWGWLEGGPCRSCHRRVGGGAAMGSWGAVALGRGMAWRRRYLGPGFRSPEPIPRTRPLPAVPLVLRPPAHSVRAQRSGRTHAPR
jgi:hypothetical protein